MTGLWIAAAAMTAAVVGLVVLPLLRRSAAPADRVEYDRAVFADQLAEIDRDTQRGLLIADQANAARIEIQRRILATARESPAKVAGTRRSPALAAVLGLAIAAGAFGLYADLGTPGAPDQPLAERQRAGERAVASGEARAAPSLDDAAETLRQRLAQSPGDLNGWLLLGRTYLSIGRYAESISAFETALELSGGEPDVAANLGEARVAAEDGRVGDAARIAFRAALAGDPGNPKALYYLALDRAQQGDVAGALQDWTNLVVTAPPDAPWLGFVRQQIALAAAEIGVDPASVRPSETAPGVAPQAPGPTREDMEAAAEMAPEERAAMIRAMVERLAARLEDEPDDLEGWRRLARAWDVLGESEKASEARRRATALEER